MALSFEFVIRNTSLAEPTKDKIISKLARLERILPENTTVHIVVSMVKQDFVLEVTIPLVRRTLRTQVQTDSLLSGVDEAVEVLERQMLRYKDRLKVRRRREKSFVQEFTDMFGEDTQEPEQPASIQIERTKRFALKPMDSEEAVMEMELLGHDFFVFRSSSTDEVNVVYRRKDGSYALIEPLI